jgi:hypothetical protein
MAIDNPGIYCQAAKARELSALTNTSDVPVQIVIDNAINTAIAAGLYTCTASMTGFTALNIQTNMGMLTALGYNVTLSGTTLTVRWF